ncbi:hypothetical protein Tco_1143941 [Tanacetum coccineum]
MKEQAHNKDKDQYQDSGTQRQSNLYKSKEARFKDLASREIVSLKILSHKWKIDHSVRNPWSLLIKCCNRLGRQESLDTEGVALEACLVTRGITMDDNLVAKESKDDSTSSEQLDECNSSMEKKDIVSSCSDSEEQHLQQLQLHARSQKEMSKKCLVVTESSGTESENSSSKTTFYKLENENGSSNKESNSSEGNDADPDISTLYDSDTVTEVPHSNNDTFENVFAHGIQNHEQPESIPDIYVINNLKCDVEKCNKVNSEAQQANALLTNELERYKEKEKHFAKDKTIESEYCKKIKLLNDEILNLKSQACQKDKTFASENGKFDEQTDHTLRMLLSKEDNVQTGKQGLSFENKNDVENQGLLNKAKELTPLLYNIDEIGKDLLSDHKIICEEELKCEAKKRLKGLVKEMKDDFKYVTSFEDEFDKKCLLLDIQTEFFKTQFKSAISESHSHVYENEMFEQNSSLENENRCLKKTITELSKQASDVIEEMTKQCAQL